MLFDLYSIKTDREKIDIEIARAKKDTHELFEGMELCAVSGCVVAFKDRINSFSDFYYITLRTLIEKNILEKLIVLEPIDIESKYLNLMLNIGTPQGLFINSDDNSNLFEEFLGKMNTGIYDRDIECRVLDDPENHCKYRIVAQSNFGRDDFTESILADNMELHIAVRLIPIIRKYYGEDSEIYPVIKPVIYEPFVWMP